MTVDASNVLTADTVPKYLAERADKIGVFSADAPLKATAIAGGNVNYAFCVTNTDTGRTVFVKQAPEYVAVFGPDGLPLTSQRMRQEYNVYQEWSNVLGSELAARYLPKIHFLDDVNMVFVMDFLDGYSLLDHDLVEKGVVPISIAEGLADFMARVHFATHCSQVSPERVAQFTKEYENRAMRDIQLEFVFTKCYKEATDEQRAGLTVDDAFLAEIEQLKA
jgi:5-methylthioribose kinase